MGQRNAANDRQADVLATNWMLGKPAAFDSPLHLRSFLNMLPKASVTEGSAAFVAEERKHRANDAECAELGIHPTCSRDLRVVI